MNTTTTLDPLISEFETEEQEARYDAWLTAKLTRSMADPRPRIPHDEVMAEMKALIERKARQQRA